MYWMEMGSVHAREQWRTRIPPIRYTIRVHSMNIQYILCQAGHTRALWSDGVRRKFDGRVHTFRNHIIRTSGTVGLRQKAARDLHVNIDIVVIAIASVVDGGVGVGVDGGMTWQSFEGVLAMWVKHSRVLYQYCVQCHALMLARASASLDTWCVHQHSRNVRSAGIRRQI